jgi:hypothetical protein
MDSYSFRCGGRVVVTGKVVVSKEFLSEENLGTIGFSSHGVATSGQKNPNSIGSTSPPWFFVLVLLGTMVDFTAWMNGAASSGDDE